MKFKDRARNFDVIDISLIKWSSIVFALFVVSAWPTFANWITKTHWAWFLIVALILGSRPTYRFFKRR